MTLKQDTRHFGNYPTSHVDIDIKKSILLADKYRPMDTPLLTDLAEIGNIREVATPRFEMMVEGEIPADMKVAAYNPGTKTATLDSAVAGDEHVNRVRINDVVMVTSKAVGSASVLYSTALVMGIAGNDIVLSSNLALSADDVITNINSASADATRSRLSITNDLNFDYNLIQIFKDGIELGEQLLNTATYEGDPLKRFKNSSIRQHKEGINKAVWFNNRATVTVSGKPVNIMGGIMWLLNNVTPVSQGGTPKIISLSGANLAIENLDDVFMAIFRRGKRQKKGYGNSYIINQLNSLIRSFTTTRYSISEKTNKWGINITEIFSPFGVLQLEYEPNFDGVFNGCVILDLSLVTLCKQKGLGTRLLKDVQDKDFAGKRDEIRSYMSAELGVPEAHSIIFA